MKFWSRLQQALAWRFERWRKVFARNPDFFLRRITGLIHVGANEGQERHLYAAHGLDVLWIEPLPDVFEVLCRNLEPYPRQRALCRLVTDVDGKEYEFHVGSNRGEASSILDLGRHKEMWPNVDYTGSLFLKGITLTTLLREENIDPAAYQALVLDTQGAEPLVLQGARELLGQFQFIKLEVPDFESYKGCWMLPQMTGYLAGMGFREVLRAPFSRKKGVGTYYDVVYQRRGPRCGGFGKGAR